MTYKEISANENERAIALAEMPNLKGALIHNCIYYPNLVFCAKVTVDNSQNETYVSHDLAAAAWSCSMIDVDFLLSLPSCSFETLRHHLLDPTPLSRVTGANHSVPVLGVLSLPLQIGYSMTDGGKLANSGFLYMRILSTHYSSSVLH